MDSDIGSRNAARIEARTKTGKKKSSNVGLMDDRDMLLSYTADWDHG
jgi:hypothetical protein